MRPLAREYRIPLERDKPRTRDGRRQAADARWAATYASIQLVLFHPGDVELMAGSPEARRALSRSRARAGRCRATRARVADYDKALRSRNRLLKTERPERALGHARTTPSWPSSVRASAARAQALVAELAPLRGAPLRGDHRARAAARGELRSAPRARRERCLRERSKTASTRTCCAASPAWVRTATTCASACQAHARQAHRLAGPTSRHRARAQGRRAVGARAAHGSRAAALARRRLERARSQPQSPLLSACSRASAVRCF